MLFDRVGFKLSVIVIFYLFLYRSDRSHSENCFVCLTNQGDLCIHTLPDLRRQVLTNCMRKEDVIGISTLVLTKKGEAFYMCSPSELQRVSVAAARVLRPSGILTLPPGARPDPPSPLAQPTVTVTAPEEAAAAAPTEERENEQNELQAQAASAKSEEEKEEDREEDERRPPPPPAPAKTAASPTDQHNDTTVSEISADITLDSVKDHTQAAVAVAAVAAATAANESSVSSSSKVERSEASASTGTTPKEQEEQRSNINGGEEQGIVLKLTVVFLRLFSNRKTH